jgi:uncharacterized protein
MENIYIPHLTRHQDHTLKIPIDQTILDLETLTPVRGKMTIQHQGSYLAVSAQADSIITLTCNRCLCQYNQRLELDASEVIWLDDNIEDVNDGPIERKVDFDDLVESLPPDGHIDPETWLYEHLCLALPLRPLCNEDCAGLVGTKSEVEVEEPGSIVDGRWGSLAALRDKLPD